MPTLGILTSSDLGAQGQREDTSGPRIREMLAAEGFEVSRYEVVPDEQAVLEDRLRRWADDDALDLIVTTGGTGLTSRDITPEATRAVVHREVPGMAEAMRMQTLKYTPMAMVSRAVVGGTGTHADHQPARESQGRAGVPGGGAARHFSCSGYAARGATGALAGCPKNTAPFYSICPPRNASVSRPWDCNLRTTPVLAGATLRGGLGGKEDTTFAWKTSCSLQRSLYSGSG